MLVSPMRRVNELVSADIGNYQTNKKNWDLFYNAKEEGLKGNGVTDDYTALSTLINHKIDGEEATIIFAPGTYVIGTSITIPSNINLYLTKGAKLSPNSGDTITINGSIEAGLWQIFAGAGTIAGSMDVEEVYPQWFGAKGDGVTNDTTAIQAAATCISNGGTLYLPSGTYMGEGITLNPKTKVIGAGGAVLKGVTGISDILNLNSNCLVDGIEIDGNKSNKTGGKGITVSGKTNVTIRNCYIHDTFSQAISISNTTKYKVINNTIENAGGVGATSYQGVDLYFSNNGVVEGNQISNCLHGVQFWGGDSATLSTTGIFDISISNNIVKSVKGGIWGSLGERIVVQGNTVETTTDVGIDFEGCKNSSAVSNSVKDCTNGCYSVFYGCDGITFSDNTALQTGSNTRAFWATTSKTNKNIIVTGSSFQVTSGLVMQTDSNSLQESRITNNRLISGSSSAMRILDGTKIDIVNNRMDVVGGYGIRFEGPSDSRIVNNTITTSSDGTTGGAQGGIYMFRRSTTYPCQRNDVNGNKMYGFVTSINDDCFGDVTSNNWIRHNRVSTIYRRSGAGYAGKIESNVSTVNPNTTITETTF